MYPTAKATRNRKASVRKDTSKINCHLDKRPQQYLFASFMDREPPDTAAGGKRPTSTLLSAFPAPAPSPCDTLMPLRLEEFVVQA